MAMQKQKYSISGLSVELGIDRRTLAKRLDPLQPVEVKGKSNFYHMSDVIQHLRLLANPKIYFDHDEIEDRKIAENEVVFFDQWAPALRDYLWEKEGQSTDQNAEHVLTIVQGIWAVLLEALEGWVALKSTYGLDTPEFVKLLQDPEKFKEEAEFLVNYNASSQAQKSDIDPDSFVLKIDFSEI